MKNKSRYLIIPAVLIAVLFSCESGFWDITADRDSPYDLLNTSGYDQVEISGQTSEAGFVTITVSWEAPEDVVSYDSCRIWYGLNGTADTEFTGTIDPAGTEITGLQNGETYTVVIKTVDTAGNVSDGITLTVTTTAGTLPSYLGTEDIILKKNNAGGEAIGDGDVLTSEDTVYIAAETSGHQNTEDFTLYYKVTGGDEEWHSLAGGNDIIQDLPDGPYSIDVEYRHDAEPEFQTDDVDPISFEVNVNPPGPVKSLTGYAGVEAASLDWVNPADWDFDYVAISHDQAGGSSLADESGSNSHYDSLTIDTLYTFTLKVVDTAGHESTEETVTVTPSDIISYADFHGIAELDDYFYNSVAAADGKIYTCGGTNGDTFVYSFLSDGTPNFEFGDAGLVIRDFGDTVDTDFLYDIALDSVGRIVVGGNMDKSGTDYMDIMVARYLPDGTLDTDFNSSGYWSKEDLFSAGGYSYTRLVSLVINNDDSIVFCSSEKSSYNWDVAVLKLTASGSLDSSFGSNGMYYETDGTVIGRSYAVDGVHAITHFDTGYLLLGTSEKKTESMDYDPFALALSSSGTYNTTYNTDDNVHTYPEPVGTGTDDDFWETDCIAENDSYFFVGGFGDSNGTDDPASFVIRIDKTDLSGTVINSFNDATYTSRIGDVVWDDATSTLYVVGYLDNGATGRDIYIQAMDQDGTLKTGQLTGGEMTINTLGGTLDDVSYCAVMSSGRLVVGGYTREIDEDSNAALWFIEP